MENKKRSFVVLSLLLLLLIAFSGSSIFSIMIPYPKNIVGDSRNLVSLSSSLSNLMYALKEENPFEVTVAKFILGERRNLISNLKYPFNPSAKISQFIFRI